MEENMQDTTPNKRLIRSLFSTYYSDYAPDRPKGDDTYVSSFWKHYTSFFDVQLDQNGDISSLKGTMLGDHIWSNKKNEFLDLLCILSHILILPQKIDIFATYFTARDICKKIGFNPTLSVFRHVCNAVLINKHILKKQRSSRLYFLMIGDGYGTLSMIIKKIFPNSTIFFVDLGRTLLFQAYYTQKAFPDLTHELISGTVNPDQTDFIYCPTEKLEMLDHLRFDVAVNIASMQEMNTATIERYFVFLRTHFKNNNLFYCCNRERKELSGGEISIFSEYPWDDNDQLLVDGLCPWYQYFFARGDIGLPLVVGGILIPLVKKFESPQLYRLAVLKTDPTVDLPASLNIDRNE